MEYFSKEVMIGIIQIVRVALSSGPRDQRIGRVTIKQGVGCVPTVQDLPCIVAFEIDAPQPVGPGRYLEPQHRPFAGGVGCAAAISAPPAGGRATDTAGPRATVPLPSENQQSAGIFHRVFGGFATVSVFHFRIRRHP